MRTPFSERLARGLVQSLDKSGTSEGALLAWEARHAAGEGAVAVETPPEHRQLHQEMGDAAPGAKPDAASKWAGGREILDKEAFGMYPVKERDIDAYYRVMALDNPSAKEMLGNVGMTREQVYSRIAEARRTVLTTKPSRDVHFDPKVGDYKPERKVVHDRIIAHLLQDAESPPAGEKPEILLTGGLPGSGKSTALKNPEFHQVKYAIIDSDYVKSLLAKEDGIPHLGAQASTYHAEADDVLDRTFRQAVAERRHILWDGTMKNREKLKRAVGDFHSRGYRVKAAFVELPMEKAMTRAIERFLKGGRFVDPAYIASHDHRNIKSFDGIKDAADEWVHYSTDVPRGTPARLVARGSRKVEKERIPEKAGSEKDRRWLAVNDGEDRTLDRLIPIILEA